MTPAEDSSIYELRERLVRIEEQLKALKAGFDEAILTQLKDHGKRLAALERLEQRRIGGRMAIAAIVACCSSLGGVAAVAVLRLWG